VIQLICKVCNNVHKNKKYTAKEMYLGFREEFEYFECSNCGCLQIIQLPNNIEKYYPSNYHTFIKRKSDNFIYQFLKKRRERYSLLKKGCIGKVVNMIYPSSFLDMISHIGINFNTRILDVGCGAGNFLYSLNHIGFQNLTGIDPFIERDVVDGNVRIHKNTIHELSNNHKFDLIILNHSLEHVPDQLETLMKISKILSEGGVCFIRMPVKTNSIWNYYNVNWVQLDAPRHFFIHTLKSFELLVEKSGLFLQKVIFDSDEFMFWGSEQYKKNIPLYAENSYLFNPKKSMFTRKKIKEYKRKAKKLNTNKQGDQAAFYLAKR